MQLTTHPNANIYLAVCELFSIVCVNKQQIKIEQNTEQLRHFYIDIRHRHQMNPTYIVIAKLTCIHRTVGLPNSYSLFFTATEHTYIKKRGHPSLS